MTDSSDAPTSPLLVVNAFIAAIEAQDIDAAVALLADDVEYDNVPMGKMHGAAEVGSRLGPMLMACTSVEWPVVREAAEGHLVFNERIDRFHMASGLLEMPVTGVWEVHHGKITLWRDYFDLGTYTSQMAALSGDATD